MYRYLRSQTESFTPNNSTQNKTKQSNFSDMIFHVVLWTWIAQLQIYPKHFRTATNSSKHISYPKQELHLKHDDYEQFMIQLTSST